MYKKVLREETDREITIRVDWRKGLLKINSIYNKDTDDEYEGVAICLDAADLETIYKVAKLMSFLLYGDDRVFEAVSIMIRTQI